MWGISVEPICWPAFDACSLKDKISDTTLSFVYHLAIVFVFLLQVQEILSFFFLQEKLEPTANFKGCSLPSCQPPGFLQKDQGAPTAAQRQKEREERQRQALQRRKERLRRAEERQQMEGDAWQFYLDSCPSLVYQAFFCGKKSA